MRNSITLNFTNIWGLRSNFADCKFFLDSNSPDILAQSETKLDDSIDFGHLSLRLSSFNSKEFWYSCAWSHIYVKEGLPFALDLSLENSANSYLCFQLALLHSVSYFFFLYWSPSLSICMVFDSISSKTDKVFSINPSANLLVFGDINICHKDCLTYSGGTERTDELCYNLNNLKSEMTWLMWLTFLIGSLTVTFMVLLI